METDSGADYDEECQSIHESPYSSESQYVNGVFSGMGILENPEEAERANPITYIDGTEPPFLIMHGDQDTLVSPSKTVILHHALLAAGADSTRYSLSGENHGATGGTSDMPVAEEAALTAEALGNEVSACSMRGWPDCTDCWRIQDIMSARVIIAIVGMEGALASVIGGLADCPVLAVPTSIGYGASLGGVSALLSMLNSCASGVSVVNIDNGFGAAYLGSMISHMKIPEAGGNPRFCSHFRRSIKFV